MLLYFEILPFSRVDSQMRQDRFSIKEPAEILGFPFSDDSRNIRALVLSKDGLRADG